MAVDVDTFRERFPEFEPATPEMIRGAIAQATSRVDSEVWRDKTDVGIEWLAAHILASGQFGKMARLVSKEGSTVYQQRFKELVNEVAAGFRVV